MQLDNLFNFSLLVALWVNSQSATRSDMAAHPRHDIPEQLSQEQTDTIALRMTSKTVHSWYRRGSLHPHTGVITYRHNTQNPMIRSTRRSRHTHRDRQSPNRLDASIEPFSTNTQLYRDKESTTIIIFLPFMCFFILYAFLPAVYTTLL